MCGSNEVLTDDGEAFFDEYRSSVYIHLSQCADLLLGPLAVVAPVVLWQLKKGESAFVDANGRNEINWVMTCYVYLLMSAALCFYRVGYVLVPIVAAMALAFPIKGAHEANRRDLERSAHHAVDVVL